MFSGVVSEENGDEEEYGDGDDDVSDSDEDVDDDEEADEDDQDNTSHYITKPVIASGDSIHSSLPKETLNFNHRLRYMYIDCVHFGR